MKILAELTEKSLGLSEQAERIGGSYTLRKSARGILLNEEGMMAAQYIKKYGYYKLPGGGMEMGELIEETLLREIREEVGCTAEIIFPVGVVIAYQPELLHISYCYTLKVIGEIGEPVFEADEIESEQTTVWIKPEAFLELMLKAAAKSEGGDFILQREIIFMTEYMKLQENFT